MNVVIDTSPLISFAVLGQLDLLDILFPSIIVPQAVYEEIEAAREKTNILKLPDLLIIVIAIQKKK